MKNQANYCNNNPLILDVKQVNKIMKLYYFHTIKILWDGQGKIKMYYGPELKGSYREKDLLTFIHIQEFFKIQEYTKVFDLYSTLS